MGLRTFHHEYLEQRTLMRADGMGVFSPMMGMYHVGEMMDIQTNMEMVIQFDYYQVDTLQTWMI